MRTKWAVIGLIGLAAFLSQAADVKETYDKQCASCHGKDGKGQTPAGKKVKAKDFTDPANQAAMKDDEMIKAIKEGIKKDGKTLMKPYGDKLSDQEIKDLVAFVRGFKK
jgi:cytochrome c6